ncbi:hypothetical protein GCM10017687_85240 [Streptomyces echinatus]
MNSEVPMAKTAMASRYSGRGIEWLRGEEKREKVISSPRPAPGARSYGRRVRRCGRLGAHWFRGLTA